MNQQRYGGKRPEMSKLQRAWPSLELICTENKKGQLINFISQNWEGLADLPRNVDSIQDAVKMERAPIRLMRSERPGAMVLLYVEVLHGADQLFQKPTYGTHHQVGIPSSTSLTVASLLHTETT